MSDSVIEDRGVRGETRDRELVDVAPEAAAREEGTRDVVEPDTLSGVVEPSCTVHAYSFAHGVLPEVAQRDSRYSTRSRQTRTSFSGQLPSTSFTRPLCFSHRYIPRGRRKM